MKHYTAESLEHLLASLERTYGMTSNEFYAAHAADRELEIPRFHQHVWASFYREALRMRPK